MKKQNASYSWLGWAIAGILAIFFLASIFSTNSSSDQSTIEAQTAPKSVQPTTPDIPVEPQQQPINTWQCEDATSYNQNAYDDNRCTNSNETRYVSDSQAVALDPNYSPGKSGASYYNNR